MWHLGVVIFFLLWPLLAPLSVSLFLASHRSQSVRHTTIEKVFSTGLATNFLFAACLDSVNDGGFVVRAPAYREIFSSDSFSVHL
jgi:hypothetical protein